MRRLHVLLAVGLLAACTSTPDSRPPAAVAAGGESAAASRTAGVNQNLLARGYYAQRSGTRIRYCRRHVPLGSLLPRIECVSEIEALTEVDRSDLAVDKLRRSGGGPCDVQCLTR